MGVIRIFSSSDDTLGGRYLGLCREMAEIKLRGAKLGS